MEHFLIRGGRRLEGSLKIHGAKNAALPILAASLLCEDSVLHNCPRLTDVDAACNILEQLGASSRREGDTLTVSAGKVCCCCIPDELMRMMRSSIVFLGAIVAKCGEARISMPGGCDCEWNRNKTGRRTGTADGLRPCGSPKRRARVAFLRKMGYDVDKRDVLPFPNFLRKA